MNYSIAIPVFNRADLTRKCLTTLRATLTDAGKGEVIVVDNGSDRAIADVLTDFPWVRVIRNETNRGFAAACNQATRAARGRYIVHLNNDIVALDGWLAPLLSRFTEGDVGVVGARLLFPDGTIQHAGVMLSPFRLGPEGFAPFTFQLGSPGTAAAVLQPRDFEVVTGACLATPRDLYLELGGFDETFWNGSEDVDYCLKVRARGLRVTYEPRAVLYHYESQSGPARKRQLLHNVRELATRWAQGVAPDHNRYADLTKQVRREQCIHRQRHFVMLDLPPTSLIVHGPAPADPVSYIKQLLAGGLKPANVFWAADGQVPPGVTAATDPLAVASDVTECRADRYVAFIDTRADVATEWLLELIDTVEFGNDVVAATVLPRDAANEWAPMAADAQCTLVRTALIPQHLRIDRTFMTLSGAVADWLARCVIAGRSIRRTQRPTADVRVVPADAVFLERYGTSVAAIVRPDVQRMEALSRPHAGGGTLASIVMLSWNAPEFTEMAVESIRQHTQTPYEIIIIDNGSKPETVARLRALTDVRIIYNTENTGFAYGCNQGMAAARGTHVVLLNNDVIVTDGWLEALLEAHRRDGAVGISAPLSNYVAGHQQLADASYPDIVQMHAYARERSVRYRGRRYQTDRVIGFCMCIAQSVIAEVGGIDTRYAVGNFEDDDYCLRVRAAGYAIVVCEDSFIHHFGNVTFKANNLDWMSHMQANWKVFAARWDLPPEYPANGYESRPVFARGFVRERDFVALPELQTESEASSSVATEVDIPSPAHAIALLASVRDENDWSRIAPVVANYARALTASDSVVFAIAALGDLDAITLGKRVERALSKAGIDLEVSPDIEVSDVADASTWRARFAAAKCLALLTTPELADIEPLSDRSRSGIARTIRAMVHS